MKILFLSHYFPPEVNAPASRTWENARRWVEAGHSVTVITCFPNCPAGRVFPGYRNLPRRVEMVDGIRVVRVWTHIAANKGMLRRVLNYLSYVPSAVLAGFLESRPDVVAATSPQFFCGWAGVLLARLVRRPFLLEIRDIWPESISTVGALRKGRLFRLLERLELAMYRAADHVVTVGNGYRDNLLDKGVPPRSVSVVYNGVDTRRYRRMPKDQAFLKRFGLGEGFVCGYIGTVGMAHGLEVLLRAADKARHRGWTFVVVGDGAHLDDLKARAASLGLANLVFTGLLPKQDMPAAWSALDACLIHLKKSPLFETVIPSKMFEAMGMGVPIVMGVDGESKAIVAEAGAGIPIEPENEDALLEACGQLAREGGRAYGEAGREFVVRRFDRDVLARDYLDILARVTGMRPREASVSELQPADGAKSRAGV